MEGDHLLLQTIHPLVLTCLCGIPVQECARMQNVKTIFSSKYYSAARVSRLPGSLPSHHTSSWINWIIFRVCATEKVPDLPSLD